MSHVPITQMESSYIEDGLLHVDRLLNAGTEYYSPLIPVLAGIPARLIDSEGNFIHLSQYRLLIRLPFLIGGLLLGYGARLAYGCNIGAYFSGISSASLHGWLWLAAAFVGSILGTRLRPLFGLSVERTKANGC